MSLDGPGVTLAKLAAPLHVGRTYTVLYKATTGGLMVESGSKLAAAFATNKGRLSFVATAATGIRIFAETSGKFSLTITAVLDCADQVEGVLSIANPSAHWTLPDSDARRPFVKFDVALEVQASLGAQFEKAKAFDEAAGLQSIGSTWVSQAQNVNVGFKVAAYRVSVTPCHAAGCYSKQSSEPVNVCAETPKPGRIAFTLLEGGRARVEWQAFATPCSVGLYQWAISVGKGGTQQLSSWQTVARYQSAQARGGTWPSSKQASFKYDVNLNDLKIPVAARSKQLHLVLRAYDTSGQFGSAVAAETSFSQAAPPAQSGVLDHGAKLPQMGADLIDQAFANTRSSLAASWKMLWLSSGVDHFKWSVSRDPRFVDCAPGAAECGATKSREIEAQRLSLVQGATYFICIRPVLQGLDAAGSPTLEESSNTTCSNGITVDSTPPLTGQVHIASTGDSGFQTDTSTLSISWHSFLDVEEAKDATRANGIAYYTLSIGSSPFASDTVQTTSLNSATHYIARGLSLISGQVYYATVTAYDYVGLSAVACSSGVTLDGTSPSPGHVTVSNTIIDHDRVGLFVQWDEFADEDSGIESFALGVGYGAGYDDLQEFKNVGLDTTSKIVLNGHDGHRAYVTVRAKNRAGLISKAVSSVITVDTRPPSPGVVYDGPAGQTEVQHQTSRSMLQAHWSGFSDAAGEVKEYSWAVSDSLAGPPGNVMAFTSVHLDSSASASHLALQDGVRYYVTVRACDHRHLCAESTSDGVLVDGSPPVPGAVFDGVGQEDASDQASGDVIGASWVGFHDPDSLIAHFEWCAEPGDGLGHCSNKGSKCLVQWKSAGTADRVLYTGLAKTLPQGSLVFVSVRATNAAGLQAVARSNGVQINHNRPAVTTLPKLINVDGNQGVQASTSVVRASWAFDGGSAYRYHWFVDTHHDGESPMAATGSVPGRSTGGTIAGVKLHDGYRYFITVVACNVAGLCTTSTDKQGMLVDSSAPITGTVDELMSWTPSSVVIKLSGFSDPHSGISSYFVSLGRKYGQSDIVRAHKVAGSATAVTVPVPNGANLKLDDTIHIMIRATNPAGISSTPFHATAKALAQNTLLVHRHTCPITCSERCSCGAYGICIAPQSLPCATKASATVKITLANPSQFQADSSVLTATWKHTGQQGLFTEHALVHVGAGAINPSTLEWSDASDVNVARYVAQADQPRINGQFTFTEADSTGRRVFKAPAVTAFKYGVAVRVWLSDTEYALALPTQPGVSIDTSKPHAHSFYQIRVKDVALKNANDAASFEDHAAGKAAATYAVTATVEFAKVFSDDQSGLASLRIAVGSIPGGDDAYKFTDVATTKTSAALTGLTLAHARTYYVTVLAKNRAGLETWRSSSGFQLDVTSPVVGSVTDGKGPRDAVFQSSTTSLAAWWTGFFDPESPIQSYSVSAGTTKGGSDIVKSQNVGLRTFVTFDSLSLKTAQTYYITVVATNTEGLASTAYSDGVVVDATPAAPVAARCESSSGVQSITDTDNTPAFSLAATFTKKLVTQAGQRYTLQFAARLETNAADQEQSGTVRVSGRLGRLVSRPFTVTSAPSKGWSNFAYEFTSDASSVTVELAPSPTYTSKAGMTLKDVALTQLQACGGKATNPIDVGPLFQSSARAVAAVWHLDDEESGIVDYRWAVGLVSGGEQLLPYTPVGTSTHAETTAAAIPHGATFYVSVTARNGAGLVKRFVSEGVTVDHTPPMLGVVLDGTGKTDVDFQSTTAIAATWAVRDDESGVLNCMWKVGSSPGGKDLLGFTAQYIAPDGKSASATKGQLLKPVPHGSTAYVTVVCTNKAGASTQRTSDGVTVLLRAPLTQGATVHARPLLAPTIGVPYLPIEGYLPLPTVGGALHVEWDHFDGGSAHLSRYDVQLVGKQVPAKWADNQLFTSIEFADLTLIQGET